MANRLLSLLLVGSCILAVLYFFQASRWIGKPFPGFLVYRNGYTSPDWLYWWTGRQGGIRFNDRIVGVDGRTLQSPAELIDYVRTLSPGSRVVYTIVRHGEKLELSVPTVLFGRSDFLLYFLPLFAAGIAYLVIGAWVFRSQPHRPSNRLFVAFCVPMGVWLMGGADFSMGWNLLPFTTVALLMAPATFLHLGLSFPRPVGLARRRPSLRALPYLMSLALGLFYVPALYGRRADWLSVEWAHFALLAFSVVLFVSLLLATVRRASTAVERQRAQVMLLGSVIAFLIPGLGLLVSSLLASEIPVNILVLPTLVFPFSIAYAIRKHHLFDVHVIIRRSLVYTFLTGILSAVYALLLITSDAAFRSRGITLSPIVSVAFILAFVLLLDPLRLRLQKVVDRLFFRNQYEFQQTVRLVSDDLANLIDLDQIVWCVLRAVARTLGVSRGIAMLWEASSRSFVEQAEIGGRRSIPPKRVLAEEALMKLVRERRGGVIRSELLEDPDLALEQREGHLRTFASLGVAVVIPMLFKDQMNGLLALGEKRSGEDYSREDLQLLETLCNQTAVSVENAFLFREIKETRDYLDNLIDSSADAIVTTDRSGRVTLFNSGAKAIFGYGPEEVIGTPVWHYYYEGLQKAEEIMEELRRHGKLQNREISLVAADGRVIPMSLSASLLRDHEGTLLGTVGILKDITESKAMEERLRKMQEYLHNLIDSSSDIILSTDSSDQIVLFNRGAQSLLGYSSEEIVGKPLATLGDRPEWMDGLRRGLEEAGGPPGSFETRLLRKGGRFLPVLATVAPLREGGAPVGLVAIFKDITERKEMELQLLQSEKLSAIGGMISGVAHELNNPLSAVMGYCHLLNLKTEDEEMRRDLEKISIAAERCERIVRNLLSFARRHKPAREEGDIGEVLERTLELKSYHFRVDNIRVVRKLAADLPRTVADFHQFQQVFLNLINNAHQAMVSHRGRGTLTVETKVDRGRILVSFTDDGPGIEEGQLSRIFDPFFTTKEVGQGTGLGLSLSYGIVKEHGGSIQVVTQVGEGSTFTVAIPIEAPKKVVRAAGRTARAIRPAKVLDGQRVLVVDDEEHILDILSRILGKAGCRVDTASNGNVALQKIEENPYDLVISDLKMPEVDGFELSRLAVSRDPRLGKRILFLTGDTVSPETQSLLEQTGHSHLSKPFDPEALTQLVGDLLAEVGKA